MCNGAYGMVEIGSYLSGLSQVYNYYNSQLLGKGYRLFLSNGDRVFINFNESFCSHLLGVQYEKLKSFLKINKSLFKCIPDNINLLSSFELLKFIVNNSFELKQLCLKSADFYSGFCDCISPHAFKKLRSISKLNDNSLIDFYNCSVVVNPNSSNDICYYVVFNVEHGIIALGIQRTKFNQSNNDCDCLVSLREFSNNRDSDFYRLFNSCEVTYIHSYTKFNEGNKDCSRYLKYDQINGILSAQKKIYGDVPIILNTTHEFSRLISIVSQIEKNYCVRLSELPDFFNCINDLKKYKMFVENLNSVFSNYNLIVDRLDCLEEFKQSLSSESKSVDRTDIDYNPFHRINYEYEERVRNRRVYLLANQLKNPCDKRKKSVLAKYSVSKICKAIYSLNSLEREFLFKVYVGEYSGNTYEHVDRDTVCKIYDLNLYSYKTKKYDILSFLDSVLSNDAFIDRELFKESIFKLSDSRKKWIMLLRFGFWDSNRYSLSLINDFLVNNGYEVTCDSEIDDIYNQVLSMYNGKSK